MGGCAGREAAGELEACRALQPCTTWRARAARAARSRSRLLDSRGQGGAALTARVSRRCRGMQAARRSRRWRLRGGDRRRGWVCTRGGRAAQPWHDTAVSWGRDRCKAFTGQSSRVAFAGRSPWRRAGSARGDARVPAVRGASLREVACGAARGGLYPHLCHALQSLAARRHDTAVSVVTHRSCKAGGVWAGRCGALETPRRRRGCRRGRAGRWTRTCAGCAALMIARLAMARCTWP